MNTNHSSFRSYRALLLFVFLASAITLLAAPPAISLHPAVVTATNGASATFTVAATAAAPLTYQWRHLGVPLAGGDTATLNLPAVSLVDAGFYDVVVTAGAESTVSQPGRLLVQPTTVAGTYRVDPTFSFVAETVGGGVTVARLTAAGEVLVGGSFATIAGMRRDGLARLTSTFAYDDTFTPCVAGVVDAIVEQPDGRILIGGGFTHVNGVPRSCIARINADGTLDDTFFPGTGLNSNVYAIVLQPDGCIVVGGNFTQLDGVACGRIVRLTADGSRDPTFSVGTGFDSSVMAMARQSDGRLVVGGYFALLDGHPVARLARLQSGGAFDPTFVLGSGCNAPVLALVALADDQLLVGGSFTSYADVAVNRVMRLAVDGSRDSTFSAPAGINGTVRSLAVAPSSRVVIGGDFDAISQRDVARLNADGTVDATWLPPASARPASSVHAVASYANGRVVAGGAFTQIGSIAGTASGLVRYSNTGTTNITPVGALRQAATVNAAVPAAGGRWVVGGMFTHINGVARNRIARIEADGAVDVAFDPGTGFDWTVSDIVAQGNDRLLVAGVFSTFNGSAAASLVRLESSGARDFGFALDLGIKAGVNAIALQPDGRILIGGDFAMNFGSVRNNVARLQTNGDLDSTFDTGPGQSGLVLTLAVHRDGRIVAGGGFTQFNALSRGRAARFDASGAPDSTFNAGTGFDGSVNALVIRGDESLVLGGTFQNLDGAPRQAMAGFTVGGSMIPGYNSGTGFTGGAVLGIDALPDGRLLAAGSFTGLAGQLAAGLARLSAAGAADPEFATFDRSLGGNFGVIAAGDGRILLLGPTAVRGNARQLGLVVLRPESSPLPAIGSGPASQIVPECADVVFAVGATGAGPLHYQWLKNGVALIGESTAMLVLNDVLSADSASYSVIVRNDYGSAMAAAVLTVAPAGSYLGWAAAHFTADELLLPAVSGATADPDGAGVSNMLRYAFGLPARGPVISPTNVLTVVDGGSRYLAVRFTRVAVSNDLLYTVQSSGNLVDWDGVAVIGAGVPVEQTARDTVPISATSRRFLRVQVELAP